MVGPVGEIGKLQARLGLGMEIWMKIEKLQSWLGLEMKVVVASVPEILEGIL